VALQRAEEQAARGYARAIEQTRAVQDQATGDYVRVMGEIARLRAGAYGSGGFGEQGEEEDEEADEERVVADDIVEGDEVYAEEGGAGA